MSTKFTWRRMVIKVGSALIAPDGKSLSTEYLLNLANFIMLSRKSGKDVILVSSGSVAAGATLNQHLATKKNRSIPEKQALAAIGQPLVMQHWQKLFDFPCAQVLLTLADLKNRQRFVNAKNTINKLIELNTLPIINENDSVAVDELKVGDNDNLAAYVALLVDADKLLICSDVDGLFDSDPLADSNAQFIPQVDEITADILAMASSTSNPLATGGMHTKLVAAQKATQRGIDTIIVNGTDANTFQHLVKGHKTGTWFSKVKSPLAAKKHWIIHLNQPCGVIEIDAGAENALKNSLASLLPSGIVKVVGSFHQGDVVEVKSRDTQQVIAVGISQYSSEHINKIKQQHSKNIQAVLGFMTSEEVINRDDLIVI